VLIVEAEGPRRAGLVSLLQDQGWIRQCLVASQREDAAALTREYGPDIAVVEVSAFLSTVVDAIRGGHQSTRIILHSPCPVAGSVLTRQMRAVGFIGPEASSTEIVEIIRRVALDEHVSSSTQRVLHAELNDREQEILKLLSTGATNREIADVVHLGPDSIAKYATRIYRKLGVRNRLEAAQRYSALLGEA
jgi:two-component system response regulator DesR